MTGAGWASEMRRRVRSALAAALLIVPALGTPLHAQASRGQPSDTTAAPPSGPLFTAHDAVVAGAFVAGTAALFPFDERLAHWFQRPSLQNSDVASHVATAARVLAIPGTLVITPALYIVGRVGHHPHAADLGLHAGESVVVALGTTFFLKGLVGRARPFVVNDTNPFDFKFGGGFTDAENRSSFPSGHATAAFAMAAATTAETSRWWPGSARYMAPLLYGAATLTGLSRMYDDDHWASDIMFAAAIGTFSGWKVVRFNHQHPDNWIDRWLLSASIAPTGAGGALVVWSVTTR